MGNLRDLDKYFQWDARARRYRAVLQRRDILPAWLYFDLSDVSGVYTVSAATSPATPSRLVSFKQPYFSLEGLDAGFGAPFEIRHLLFEDSTDGTDSANFLVSLRELGETRLFMNRPIHIRTICGTAQQPARLREPYMLLSQHNIQAQFTKISGGATTMRMYLGGAQYFPWSLRLAQSSNFKKYVTDGLKRWFNRRQFVSPFWLTTDTDVTLAGNANGSFDAKIGDDGHFEMFTLMAIATGNFQMSISEVLTKQTLMNGTVTQTNAIGTAQFPSVFAFPYIVPAGYRLRFNITDLSGSTNNIYLTMAGRKIFAPFKDVKGVLADAELPVSSEDRVPVSVV